MFGFFFSLTIGAFLLTLQTCLLTIGLCSQWESVSERLKRTVSKEAQVQAKSLQL